MDIVLGVSMTPSAIRMVLVEGEKADGASLDHDAFDTVGADSPATSGVPQQVLDAILGTRESAAEGGHRLTSVGVAWTDHAAAAELRQSMRQNGVRDVLLVSELHAASALAQAIGESIGCDRTALLFVEQDTATVAVIRTKDGAVVRVVSRSLPGVDSVTDLRAMVADLDEGDEPAQAVFMVGSGVDVAALQPHVAMATNLPVHAPDDGDLALARGAALASANAPRYEATTVGLYSGEDTAAGATQMAAAGYMAPLGYSAVPDDDDDPLIYHEADDVGDDTSRRPALLVGSVMSTIFVVGVAALAVSLAVVIRPTADQRPSPGDNPVVSNTLAPPVPAQAKEDAAAPAAPETIQAPIPVVQEAPRNVVVPPAAPAPAVEAAAPAAIPAPAVDPAPAAPPPAAPAPLPAAPAPAPIVVPAPVAPPIVLPVPIVLPPIFQAPSRSTPPRTTPDPTTAPTTAAPTTASPTTAAPTTAAPSTTQAPSTQAPSSTTTIPASTYDPEPSRSSYPTATPPVTTYPTVTTYPAGPATDSGSGYGSIGAGSSGSSGSGSSSSDSGSSSRSGGPLWPWPFGG